MTTFPAAEWERVEPAAVGFDAEKLAQIDGWLDENADPERGYRLAVVRRGYLVYERNQGLDPDEHLPIASAAKSVYSNVLGIVIAEGKLTSAEVHVADVYPEMLDVPSGFGPKEGRYAFPKDRAVTFRQLISNTSGYMKPGEEPGTVFHYQTYGMNVLTHALAKLYDLYDVANPEGLPGFPQLIAEKIATPIGANWSYALTNFDLHADARLGIFGYYTQIHTHPRDLARVGWLWANWGRWGDRQVVPEPWLRASVRTNPDLRNHEPKEKWQYGYGFWTNDEGQMWEDLPRDAFTASGAGGHYATVFPSHDLVIVQNPGPYHKTTGSARANPALLKIVLHALEE